jgi:hypothetical protein
MSLLKKQLLRKLSAFYTTKLIQKRNNSDTYQKSQKQSPNAANATSGLFYYEQQSVTFQFPLFQLQFLNCLLLDLSDN